MGRLRSFGKSTALRSISIIAITSQTLDGEEQTTRAAGCDSYMPEPYSSRQLLAKKFSSACPNSCDRLLHRVMSLLAQSGHHDRRYLCPLSGVRRTSPEHALMSASLIGRVGSSAFRPSTAVSMSLAGSCSSPDSALGPFHHGIRGQGGTIFEAAFAVNGRSKRTCELTSSIVPRGTSFHCSADLEFPSIGFDPVDCSCCCRRLFPGPTELSAINPDAMHDHG